MRETKRPEPAAGGYRAVLRDRLFVHLAITNVALIAVGWGAFTWLVPPFASNDLGLNARLIGLLLLANAATVVVGQVPVARFAEGRRRVMPMAVASALFAGAGYLPRHRGRRGRRGSMLRGPRPARDRAAHAPPG